MNREPGSSDPTPGQTPEVPSTRPPEESVTRTPEEPATQPEEPATQPEEPATQPEEPATQSPRYTETSLFRRIAHSAERAGISVIYAILVMFYTLQEPSTPAMAKLTILGALGYFISPVDFFPDFLPGGYSEDIAIIIGALLTVAIHVNDVARNLAREKLHEWFGNYDEADLQEIEARMAQRKERKERKS